jgi:hypothetical protein
VQSYNYFSQIHHILAKKDSTTATQPAPTRANHRISHSLTGPRRAVLFKSERLLLLAPTPRAATPRRGYSTNAHSSRRPEAITIGASKIFKKNSGATIRSNNLSHTQLPHKTYRLTKVK